LAQKANFQVNAKANAKVNAPVMRAWSQGTDQVLEPVRFADPPN
jgi:hypothetical protein